MAIGSGSPLEAAEFLAGIIAPKVVADVKEALRTKPEAQYVVFRQSAVGPVKSTVSLAQIMAELIDQMKLQNAQTAHLIYELQENRKVGEEIRKQNKKKRRHEDEDDE